jgi:DNA-binding winged helix-turn-helix (wHTH) protein
MLWSRIKAPPLTIDRIERRAMRAGRQLELSPLLLRLVEHLAERPGHVVTRTELKRVLWPYAERIDTERRLNTAMRALRVALGDDADAPRYIETVRSHGYRWVNHGNRRSLTVAITFAMVAISSLAISPRPATATPDLGALLKAQSAMEQWRLVPTEVAASRASALLSQADSQDAAAPSLLTMRAELELGSEWRWLDAERDYQRALDRDPGNADARIGLAWLRVNQGRREEALALVRDMLSNGIVAGDRRASLGWLLIRAGRPDFAVATCGNDEGASINDLSCSHEAFAALGRYADAKEAALRLMQRVPATPAAIEQVRAKEPRQAYQTFLTWRAHNFLPANASWFQKAQVLADAGDTQSALKALQQSIARREPTAVKIRSTPGFAAMRGNPSFDQLSKAVGA